MQAQCSRPTTTPATLWAIPSSGMLGHFCWCAVLLHCWMVGFGIMCEAFLHILSPFFLQVGDKIEYMKVIAGGEFLQPGNPDAPPVEFEF